MEPDQLASLDYCIKGFLVSYKYGICIPYSVISYFLCFHVQDPEQLFRPMNAWILVSVFASRVHVSPPHSRI